MLWVPFLLQVGTFPVHIQLSTLLFTLKDFHSVNIYRATPPGHERYRPKIGIQDTKVSNTKFSVLRTVNSNHDELVHEGVP